MTVGSIYLNETLGGKYRIMSNSLIFIFWGAGGVIVNIHSIWFNHYKYYFFIQMISGLIPFIMMMCLPKSPFFLYKIKNYIEMTDVLTNMAKFNNIEDWEEKYRPMLIDEIDDLERIKSQRETLLESTLPEQSQLRFWCLKNLIL